MADINIQRKSGVSSAVWWIFGIIVVAVLLWLLFAWGEPEGIGRLEEPPARVASASVAIGDLGATTG